MNRPNQPIDDAVKNTLQQHEFDFDASAWEAMNQKLDNQEGKNKGINWVNISGVFVGLLLLGLLIWAIFPANTPATTESFKQETAIDAPLSTKSNTEDGNFASSPTGQLRTRNIPKSTDHSSADVPLSSAQDASVSANSSKTIFPKEKVNQTTAIGSQDKSLEISSEQQLVFSKSNQQAISNTLEKNSNKQDQSNTVSTNPYPVSTPSTSSEESRSSIDQLAMIALLPVNKVVSNEASGSIKKAFTNLEKVSVQKPFRWYVGAELGVLFPTFINGIINIDDHLLVSRSAVPGRKVHGELKAGIHLRKNTALELGFSYVPLLYQFQYSYFNDPVFLTSTGIENVQQKIHQFNIPLRWQIKMGEDLRLGFGAGLSIRSLDKKLSADYVPPTRGAALYHATRDIYAPVLVFWESSIGYDRGQWTLDLRFQRSFTPIFNDFTFNGHTYSGHASQRSFSLAFGRRFQKFQDPIQVVRSRINQSKIAPFKPGFNWGIGIATGHDDYSAGQPLLNFNFNLGNVITPLKLGLWGYQDLGLYPQIRVQGELWMQKYKLPYSLDDGGGTFVGELDTNFVSSEINISRLEIPLTLHYRFPNNMRITGGLGWEFNFTKPADEAFYTQFRGYSSFIRDLPSIYKKSNFNYDLGVGYDWAQFSFDIRYRAPIKATDHLFNSAVQFSHKEQVEISLKYAFRRR